MKRETFQLDEGVHGDSVQVSRVDFRPAFRAFVEEVLARVDADSSTASATIAIGVNKGEDRVRWHAEHVTDGRFNSIVEAKRYFDRWLDASVDEAVTHVDRHIARIWDGRSKITMSNLRRE